MLEQRVQAKRQVGLQNGLVRREHEADEALDERDQHASSGKADSAYCEPCAQRREGRRGGHDTRNRRRLKAV